ncbi:hypothetical protein PIB30_103568, partial [Stylosanthes scabra]|nr:hypothetical protein [Stylosanthes scabra]
NMAEEKDNVPLKTDGVADEPIPLKVIPFKVWTQPYGTELYDWVATEVLGTRSKVTKEYLDEMLKENIVCAPNHNTKYKLEVPDVNERICFINHRAGEVPDWLWVFYKGSDPHPTYFVLTRNPTSGRSSSLTLTAPKNGNMDDSGRGFLSFRAHGKMKIFEFSDESSNFKDMYFKISRAPRIQPFYFSSEKKAKFSLYWRMGYHSPRPEANALSEEEKKAASLLRSAWGKEHLNLKDLMCDDEIAKRTAIEMAGGLDALIAMRHRLVTKQQTSGNKEASSSATVDLTGGTLVAGKPVEPDQSEEKVPSPQSFPAKKRKKVPREVTEEFGTSVNALEKGFNPVLFVDQYLMTQEAEEALEGIEAVDSTIRIQRMLLRAVVHCRDVQREVARIPKLQNMLSEKENHIKTLGSWVTDLEAEVQFRGAEVLRLEGVEKTLD